MASKPESVVGFLFWKGQVLLVNKARPAWQTGKLNGVGGQTEPGEKPVQAMCREFREETDLTIPSSDWQLQVILNHGKGVVYFFSCHAPDVADWPKKAKNQDTSEPLEWHPWHTLPYNVLYNLRWLIPLCGDNALQGPASVTYDDKTAHNRAAAIPPDCLGRRYVVVTEQSGPIVGTVESSTDDGVTLYDVRRADGVLCEKAVRLALSDRNIQVFMSWPLDEKDTLRLAEFMYQDGRKTAGKEGE